MLIQISTHCIMVEHCYIDRLRLVDIRKNIGATQMGFEQRHCAAHPERLAVELQAHALRRRLF